MTISDKLSSHQASHMHNTRHRTNSHFNTPLFNHSKTQKCYLCQLSNSHMEQPTKFAYKLHVQITFQKQNKSHLLASQSTAMSKLSMSTVPN